MQVHRFHDTVAVYVGGYTRYIKPDVASDLADAIIQCVDDIELNPEFSQSQVGTWNHEPVLPEQTA